MLKFDVSNRIEVRIEGDGDVGVRCERDCNGNYHLQFRDKQFDRTCILQFPANVAALIEGVIYDARVT